MSGCAMPWAPAHALPLSGWVVRKSLSWLTSQLDTFCVPPYKPSAEPDMTFAPCAPAAPVAVGVAAGAALVAAGGALVGDVV